MADRHAPTLYHVPGNSSLIPHILLEELGWPYELRLIDRANGEDKTPAFRALNPNGLVPVLVDHDVTVYETAAICLHLLDRSPGTELIPPVGSPARSLFYQWLMWLTNSLQPAMKMSYFAQRWSEDEAGAAQVRSMAVHNAASLIDVLAAEFERHGQLWLAGPEFSAADIYAFVVCRWTARIPRPARDRPVLRSYMERVAARPAVARTLIQEGLSPPWV